MHIAYAVYEYFVWKWFEWKHWMKACFADGRKICNKSWKKDIPVQLKTYFLTEEDICQTNHDVVVLSISRVIWLKNLLNLLF